MRSIIKFGLFLGFFALPACQSCSLPVPAPTLSPSESPSAAPSASPSPSQVTLPGVAPHYADCALGDKGEGSWIRQSVVSNDEALFKTLGCPTEASQNPNASDGRYAYQRFGEKCMAWDWTKPTNYVFSNYIAMPCAQVKGIPAPAPSVAPSSSPVAAGAGYDGGWKKPGGYDDTKVGVRIRPWWPDNTPLAQRNVNVQREANIANQYIHDIEPDSKGIHVTVSDSGTPGSLFYKVSIKNVEIHNVWRSAGGVHNDFIKVDGGGDTQAVKTDLTIDNVWLHNDRTLMNPNDPNTTPALNMLISDVAYGTIKMSRIKNNDPNLTTPAQMGFGVGRGTADKIIITDSPESRIYIFGDAGRVKQVISCRNGKANISVEGKLQAKVVTDGPDCGGL